AKEFVEALETIYIHREPDQGGATFAEGMLQRLEAIGFTGKVFELRMPDGIKDPADLHVASPEQFKARFAEAIEASTPLDLSPTYERNGRAHQRTAHWLGATESKNRPVITISTEEHEVNAEAVQALDKEDSLYQRGGMLVRIVRDVSPAAKGIR